MRINHPQPSSGAFEESQKRKPALVGWLGLSRRTFWALVIGVSLGLRAVSSAFVWRWEQAPQCEGLSEPFRAGCCVCPAFPVAGLSNLEQPRCFLAELSAAAWVDLTGKCFLSESSGSSLGPLDRKTLAGLEPLSAQGSSQSLSETWELDVPAAWGLLPAGGWGSKCWRWV